MFNLNKKYIFVDWNNLALKVRSDCYRRNETKLELINYSILKKLFSVLKKIGIDDKDIVFICANSNSSWRQDIDKNWKYNRFPNLNLIYTLEECVPFFILVIPNIESRDIISYGVRNFNGEKIIISSEESLEQLNSKDTKIFSPFSNKYKILKYEINTITNKLKNIKTKLEYEKRFLLENLCKLPDYIDQKIKEHIDNNYGSSLCKIYNIELFPFKSLLIDFEDIYRKNKVVKVSDSFKKKKKKLEVISLF